MPKSKTHSKRRKKQDDKRVALNKWVRRRVKEFNELPQEDRAGFIARRRGRKTRPEERVGVIGGISNVAVEEKEDV